jgi:hypothetical protein
MSSVKYELGVYIPEDDILHVCVCLHYAAGSATDRISSAVCSELKDLSIIPVQISIMAVSHSLLLPPIRRGISTYHCGLFVIGPTACLFCHLPTTH